MVIAPHALVGALTVRLAGARGAGALALGVTSHFPLDAVPHRDYALGGVAGATRLALDATLAGVMLVAADADDASLLGALGALLPDVLTVIARRSPLRLRSYERLHRCFHTARAPRALTSTLVQLAVVYGATRALAAIARA